MKTCLLCSCTYTDDPATCGFCGEATWSETIADNVPVLPDEPALQLVESAKPKAKRR